MCGIAGFCNLPNDWRDNIERMNHRLEHRGPDSEGIWSNDDHSMVLGHRRLSILDLSEAGDQPMLSHSKRYVIVFNGEIYNHKDLKRELEKGGRMASFNGHSDTEILLAYIEAYGFEEALKASKGMFAIALYDRKTGSLRLSRDRIGEKPLYFGYIGNGFVFASEIGAIREHSCFKAEIDRTALSLYFRCGYIPAPYSIYRGISKLMPGSILEIDPPYTQPSIYKYWDISDRAAQLSDQPFDGTYEDSVDEIERLLKESVASQMISDVPLGAFLSGGIDSTTIVALMQSVSSESVKTFSIGFHDDRYNEADFARQTAEYLETDHTELYVTDKDALAVIPKLSDIYGEPFADSSQIPTLLVSELARKKVTVSLSGDGGDELFCGYNTYTIIENTWNKIRHIPYPIRMLAGKTLGMISPYHNGKIHKAGHYLLSRSGEDLYSRVGTVVPLTEKIVKDVPFVYDKGFSGGCQGLGLRQDLMLKDLMIYHPDDILVKVDRSAMSVSLETRVPMLDKDVVEFALSLPLDYKYKDGISKRVLRDVLYRYIPKEMMNRPKKGFSVPIADWLTDGDLRDWMEDLLNESLIRRQGILDGKAVGRIKKDFIKHKVSSEMIWYLCMFQQWYQKESCDVR